MASTIRTVECVVECKNLCKTYHRQNKDTKRLSKERVSKKPYSGSERGDIRYFVFLLHHIIAILVPSFCL